MNANMTQSLASSSSSLSGTITSNSKNINHINVFSLSTSQTILAASAVTSVSSSIAPVSTSMALPVTGSQVASQLHSSSGQPTLDAQAINSQATSMQASENLMISQPTTSSQPTQNAQPISQPINIKSDSPLSPLPSFPPKVDSAAPTKAAFDHLAESDRKEAIEYPPVHVVAPQDGKVAQDPVGMDDLDFKTYGDGYDTEDYAEEDKNISETMDVHHPPQPLNTLDFLQPAFTASMSTSASYRLSTTATPSATASPYSRLPYSHTGSSTASIVPTGGVASGSGSSNLPPPSQKAAVILGTLIAVITLVLIAIVYKRSRRRAAKCSASKSMESQLSSASTSRGLDKEFRFPGTTPIPNLVSTDVYPTGSRFSMSSSDYSASTKSRTSTASTDRRTPSFVTMFSSVIMRRSMPAPLLSPQEFFTLPMGNGPSAAPFGRSDPRFCCLPVREDKETDRHGGESMV